VFIVVDSRGTKLSYAIDRTSGISDDASAKSRYRIRRSASDGAELRTVTMIVTTKIADELSLDNQLKKHTELERLTGSKGHSAPTMYSDPSKTRP
jgi:transketolase N-terminal domain/subunit